MYENLRFATGSVPAREGRAEGAERRLRTASAVERGGAVGFRRTTLLEAILELFQESLIVSQSCLVRDENASEEGAYVVAIAFPFSCCCIGII